MTTDSTDAESASKDRFYERLSSLAEEMISEHGKEFTMGSLILAARFIAQGQLSGPRRRPQRQANLNYPPANGRAIAKPDGQTWWPSAGSTSVMGP